MQRWFAQGVQFDLGHAGCRKGFHVAVFSPEAGRAVTRADKLPAAVGYVLKESRDILFRRDFKGGSLELKQPAYSA